MDLAVQFYQRVQKSDTCWVWTGPVSRRYGQVTINNKHFRAHRMAWELERGPIPEGMSVLHRCDNPPCVRVEHLFLGSQTENVRDMERKGRANRKGQAKLTPEDVQTIRRLYAEGMLQRQIGEMFSLDQGHVSAIVNHKKWADVA